MAVSEQDWDDLRTTWAEYREAVDTWIESASGADSDPAKVDQATHRLIDAHNVWGPQLGQLVEATHHHH